VYISAYHIFRTVSRNTWESWKAEASSGVESHITLFQGFSWVQILNENHAFYIWKFHAGKYVNLWQAKLQICCTFAYQDLTWEREREKRVLKSLFLASTTRHGAKFCSVGVWYIRQVLCGSLILLKHLLQCSCSNHRNQRTSGRWFSWKNWQWTGSFMAAAYLNVSEILRTLIIYQNWVFDFCSDLWLWILRSALITMRGMSSVPVSMNCPTHHW